MASTGHILLGSHVVNHTKGSAPTSAFGYGLDLCPRGLNPVIHGEHTLETLLRGCILEFTYLGGLAPLMPHATTKTSTQEARGLWIMVSSPEEWSVVSTSF
jgi:hypothetical protein